MATYITKQQKAVLECIAQHHDECVSVNDLLEQLRRRGEAVGVATVYRQLEKLDNSQLIAKVKEVQDSFKKLSEASNTFSNLMSGIKNFFSSVGNFFSNLFGGKKN